MREARDQLRMDVIRMIKAAVMNKEMEIRKDLDDAEMSRVMTTMIKQRRESVEQFEKGNRAELAAKNDGNYHSRILSPSRPSLPNSSYHRGCGHSGKPALDL